MSQWTTAQMPAMRGRTVVVTGASRGLGLVAATSFAQAGARVIAAVRDPSRVERPGIEARKLDVSSLASVRAFAEAWTGDIDVLVNNAGVMRVPHTVTEDGFELQMATNYLGPFALTQLLLPHLTGRIVMVGSQLHRFSRLDLDDLAWQKRAYDATAAYCDSKLADLLFADELHRRFSAAGNPLLALTAHPGIARTELGGGGLSRLGPLLNDPGRGALPILYAATADLPGGSYAGPRGLGGINGYPKLGTPSRKSRDAALAGRLWDASERLTGVRSALTAAPH